MITDKNAPMINVNNGVKNVFNIVGTIVNKHVLSVTTIPITQLIDHQHLLKRFIRVNGIKYSDQHLFLRSGIVVTLAIALAE